MFFFSSETHKDYHFYPSDRNVQNAMLPLKKMAAATTWFAEIRTAKLNSAGCAWVHGNRMAQPGKNR